MFKRLLATVFAFALGLAQAWGQNVYPPIIPQNGTNLLPLNNTWTGVNTWTPSIILTGQQYAGAFNCTYGGVVGYYSPPGCLYVTTNTLLGMTGAPIGIQMYYSL